MAKTESTGLTSTPEYDIDIRNELTFPHPGPSSEPWRSMDDVVGAEL